MVRKIKTAAIGAIAVVSGAINSLLGAGGGILLSLTLPALVKEKFPDRRDVYINAQAAMIPGCALSCLIYSMRGMVDTVGFSLQKGDARICTATDTGCVTEEILSELTGADLMVLEANHDEDILKMGRYPWFLKQRILSDQGHLSNEAAGLALARAVEADPRPRQVLLAHLSKENNFP